MSTQTFDHPVVSPSEWLEKRKQLLVEEKAHTRALDKLNQMRLDLPWIQVTKPYVFEGRDGLVSLADLFQGRSQLIVQHFMFGPDWEEGCVGCSFLADHVDAARQHFENHDVSFVAISRAPFPKIQKFKERMGWDFRWVSSLDSDFNFDYQASATDEEFAAGKMTYNFKEQQIRGQEQAGLSTFRKNEKGEVFYCYSVYERGGESLIGTYQFLDIAPLGRNEKGNLTDWVKRHDKYQEPTIELICPRFVDSKPFTLAGLDRRYRYEERGGIGAQWFEFGPNIGSIAGQVGTAAYGVSSHMCDGGQSFRYLTAVEVSDTSKLADSYSAIRFPAQSYAVFSHKEHLSRICETIHAIWAKWLPASGYEVGDSPEILERYGATFDPCTGFGDIELWVPLRSKE